MEVESCVREWNSTHHQSTSLTRRQTPLTYDKIDVLTPTSATVSYYP